ncbi:MAG: hypothetical protein WBF53_08525 [Litorimonas sp.]
MSMPFLPDVRSSAFWAWEGLRRNADYRKAWKRYRHRCPPTLTLDSGAGLTRLRRRYPEAERFGLLAFADPDVGIDKAGVFWMPEVLAGALPVKLDALSSHAQTDDKIVVSDLSVPRHILEMPNGQRHIRLGGAGIWLQLFCDAPRALADRAGVTVHIEQSARLARRVDTVLQLLSIHRADTSNDILTGRSKSRRTLERSLTAFDIWHGFERPKGGLRDIAVALTNPEIVSKDWNRGSGYLKSCAARARRRGEQFVTRGYYDLLLKKTI